MTTNNSGRYVLLSFEERRLLASAARGVSQALGVVPGSAQVWGPFAKAARVLEDQAMDGAPVTEEAVERAARAMCALSHQVWDDELDMHQEEWREDARAALTAALGGGSND